MFSGEVAGPGGDVGAGEAAGWAGAAPIQSAATISSHRTPGDTSATVAEVWGMYGPPDSVAGDIRVGADSPSPQKQSGFARPAAKQVQHHARGATRLR